MLDEDNDGPISLQLCHFEQAIGNKSFRTVVPRVGSVVCSKRRRQPMIQASLYKTGPRSVDDTNSGRYLTNHLLRSALVVDLQFLILDSLMQTNWTVSMTCLLPCVLLRLSIVVLKWLQEGWHRLTPCHCQQRDLLPPLDSRAPCSNPLGLSLPCHRDPKQNLVGNKGTMDRPAAS